MGDMIPGHGQLMEMGDMTMQGRIQVQGIGEHSPSQTLK